MLVAVDAGGSSTRAVVLDTAGQCLGFATAGSGNPSSSGTELVSLALSDAVRRALASAGVSPSSIGSAVVAMAGARSDLPAGHPEHAGIVDGLTAAGLDNVPLVVESDVLAMFHTGSHALDGYALVAGTGAAAIRVGGGRVDGVADGNGWLLGDDGSGFWIGHRVVRAVAADLDRRGPSTALTPLVLDRLGLAGHVGDSRSSLVHLKDVVYKMRPIQLARLAPTVFEVGDDEVAAAVVAEASRALADTVAAVLDDHVDGPLVLGGSVLLNQESLASSVEAAFRRRGRAGEVVKVADGTAGAAVLALRHGGVAVDSTVFARVRESLSGVRERVGS
jgi:N-acetylglucosamine kinase-like BadF-type ATPase